MAYRRFLPSGTELDYVEGLSKKERKELGYKQNDKGYFQKEPSFDGKSLDDFLISDRKYYDSFRGGKAYAILFNSSKNPIKLKLVCGKTTTNEG